GGTAVRGVVAETQHAASLRSADTKVGAFRDAAPDRCKGQADGREFFREIFGSAAPAGGRRTEGRPPSSRYVLASSWKAFQSTTFLLLSGKPRFVKRKVKFFF